MKFVLKSGKYVDEEGKQFKKGDIVSSSRNLPEIFRGRFEKLVTDKAPVVDEDDDKKEEKKAPAPYVPLELQKVSKGDGTFDVINVATGVCVNAKPLTEDEADLVLSNNEKAIEDAEEAEKLAQEEEKQKKEEAKAERERVKKEAKKTRRQK
jgi:hypothetical protein